MADYYPLISRAVANLGQSSLEQRRDLYDRATAALIGQLRNSDPPIAEADITRERVALEEAIRRIETEFGGGVTRGERPEPDAPFRPEPVSPAPDSAPGARPADSPAPEPRLPSPPARPVPVPPPALEPVAVPAPIAEGLPGRPDLAVQAADGDGADVEARWRDGGALRPRPPAPRLENRDRRWIRAAVIGLAIALVVGLTATAAIMLKHQPSEFLPQAAPAPVASEGEGKFQDRLAGDGPPQVPVPVAPADPARPSGTAAAPAAPQSVPSTQQSAAAAPPVIPAQPPIGVLQRVLLIEEPPEGSQEVKQTPGRVRWRLDSVSSGPGDPLDAAVRADVEVPDAGLKLDLLIRKNRDAALPASHTIEMKFAPGPAPGSPTSVRDVGVPEMRQDEAQRGTPLAGIAVPVTENLFLTGLSNLGPDVQRNLELMRSRNWFMVPLRFASGRRALLLIEKGPTGGRTIADAFQAWQQG